jgi:predicted phage-related endonuclease
MITNIGQTMDLKTNKLNNIIIINNGELTISVVEEDIKKILELCGKDIKSEMKTEEEFFTPKEDVVFKPIEKNEEDSSIISDSTGEVYDEDGFFQG